MATDPLDNLGRERGVMQIVHRVLIHNHWLIKFVYWGATLISRHDYVPCSLHKVFICQLTAIYLYLQSICYTRVSARHRISTDYSSSIYRALNSFLDLSKRRCRCWWARSGSGLGILNLLLLVSASRLLARLIRQLNCIGSCHLLLLLELHLHVLLLLEVGLKLLLLTSVVHLLLRRCVDALSILKHLLMLALLCRHVWRQGWWLLLNRRWS